MADSAALGLGNLYGWKTGVAPLFTCGQWGDGAVLSCPGLKIMAIEGEIGCVHTRGTHCLPDGWLHAGCIVATAFPTMYTIVWQVGHVLWGGGCSWARLIFGSDLPPKASQYTADEIWAAVGSGALCIEVCRSSYSTDWVPNSHQALADANNNAVRVPVAGCRRWLYHCALIHSGSCHPLLAWQGVVVGPRISAATAREAALGVSICISASGRNLVTSEAVKGPGRCIVLCLHPSTMPCAGDASASMAGCDAGGVDPTANVVSLVNDLSAQGVTLTKGSLVITGAIAVRASEQAISHHPLRTVSERDR